MRGVARADSPFLSQPHGLIQMATCLHLRLNCFWQLLILGVNVFKTKSKRVTVTVEALISRDDIGLVPPSCTAPVSFPFSHLECLFLVFLLD